MSKHSQSEIFFFRENNDKLSTSFNVYTWNWRLSNWKALKGIARHVLVAKPCITASFGISQKNKFLKAYLSAIKKHRPYLYLFSKWWRKILQIRKWLTARGYFHSLVLMDLGEYFLPGRKPVEGIWPLQVMTKLWTFTIGESMSHFEFFRLFFVILLYFFRHAEIIDQVRLPGMATMFG